MGTIGTERHGTPTLFTEHLHSPDLNLVLQHFLTSSIVPNNTSTLRTLYKDQNTHGHKEADSTLDTLYIDTSIVRTSGELQPSSRASLSKKNSRTATRSEIALVLAEKGKSYASSTAFFFASKVLRNLDALQNSNVNTI